MPDDPTREPAARARRLASRQHGLVTRAQLGELGLSEGWIRTRVARGDLVRSGRGVFRYSGAPETIESKALAACLARPGAVLSHGSAARIWRFELPGWPERRIEVTVSVGRNAATEDDVLVHRTRRLEGADRCHVGVLPVTTSSRTLFDLAPNLDPAAVVRVVDDALTRRLLTASLLSAALDRSARQGNAKLSSVRAALEPWLAGPMESHAEARVLRWLLRLGLPDPVRQFVVTAHGAFVARVDFAWPRARVILEVDGWRWHRNPERFVADRARWTRLRAAGWDVIVTTLAEVDGDSTVLEGVLRSRLAICAWKPSI